jgi:hypothetical protein
MMDAGTDRHLPLQVPGSPRKYLNRKFGVGHAQNCPGCVTNANTDRVCRRLKRPFRDLATAGAQVSDSLLPQYFFMATTTTTGKYIAP